MTVTAALTWAAYEAQSRSNWYDVVRTPSGRFDAFPRFYQDRARSDKGVVIATFNTYGKEVR